MGKTKLTQKLISVKLPIQVYAAIKERMAASLRQGQEIKQQDVIIAALRADLKEYLR